MHNPQWSLLREAGRSSRFRVVQAFKDSVAAIAHRNHNHTLEWDKAVGKICTVTSVHMELGAMSSSKPGADDAAQRSLLPMRIDAPGLCVHILSFATVKAYTRELTCVKPTIA